MRTATVVLPVPGLPVKLMCKVGACEASPNFDRTRSTSRSAAISRMRCLTGARPNELVVELLKHRTDARLRELFGEIDLRRRACAAAPPSLMCSASLPAGRSRRRASYSAGRGRDLRLRSRRKPSSFFGRLTMKEMRTDSQP